MPPLVAHAFCPLRTHSSFASSYLAVVRIAETSEPASGSEAQKAATFGSSAVPKHCGIHSPSCSGVPCPKIAATASEVPEDAHADPGVAPEQLLVDDRQRQAGLVGPELGQPFEAVEADLGRLLDHRPGRLLALVPLGGGGPHGALGEPVDPLPDVLLVLVQLEGEPRPLGSDAAGRLRRPRRRSPLRWPPLLRWSPWAAMLHQNVSQSRLAARRPRLRGRGGRRRAGPRPRRRRSRRSAG